MDGTPALRCLGVGANLADPSTVRIKRERDDDDGNGKVGRAHATDVKLDTIIKTEQDVAPAGAAARCAPMRKRQRIGDHCAACIAEPTCCKEEASVRNKRKIEGDASLRSTEAKRARLAGDDDDDVSPPAGAKLSVAKAKTDEGPKRGAKGKREREPGEDERLLIQSMDADIAALETDIRDNAKEYQECRRIMSMGVVSIKAAEQTARMTALMDKLKSMKAARRDVMRKREQHLTALSNGDERASVLEEVREKRAKRRRLYPRDREVFTEDQEADIVLSDRIAKRVVYRSNSANCPGRCLNIVDDTKECVQVCKDCGHVYGDIRCDVENPLCTAPKFGEQIDMPRRRSGGYKPPTHFAEIVGHFQGNRSSLTPADIIDKIKWYCKRYHYKDHEITPKVARFFLRRMQQEENNRHANEKHSNRNDKLRRFTDYYKHAPEISYRLSGIPPPYMTPMQEDRVMSLFPYVIAAYKTCPRYKKRLEKKREEPKERPNGKPEKTPNNPNYLLVFYKLCQLLGYNEFLPYIPLPKNTDNIDDNDEHAWKYICGKYNWQYIETR